MSARRFSGSSYDMPRRCSFYDGRQCKRLLAPPSSRGIARPYCCHNLEQVYELFRGRFVMMMTAYLGMLNAIQTSNLINSLQYHVLDAISFSGESLSEAIHINFHGVHCQRPRYRPHSRPASYNAASFGRQLD